MSRFQEECESPLLDYLGRAMTRPLAQATPGAPVTLTNVSVRPRDHRAAAPEGVSLHVPAGQSVALYDRAGSSGVELVDVIAGRRRLRSGQVTVHGTMHRMGVPAVDRRQADRWLLSGRFTLLPSRSVAGNMLAALRSRRPDAATRARVAELLAITGAANLASRRVETLSAEQQWRVLVARALLIDPQLVIAEDPAPGLDSRAASRALDLLMDAQARFGFTLVLATGRLVSAARCERVVSLADGQVTGDELIGDDAWTRGRIDRIG
ncbi:MAG TPA: ATP-binding cassette domain-containing protein [Streptosporangiaceae bacterium]|jgi:putative ABC transport system ATP-binding protein